MQLGTHRRGKRKREEMQKVIQNMKKAQQACKSTWPKAVKHDIAVVGVGAMQYLGNAYCQRSREYRYNWGKPKSLINHSYEKIAILNMHVRVCLCLCLCWLHANSKCSSPNNRSLLCSSRRSRLEQEGLGDQYTSIIFVATRPTMIHISYVLSQAKHAYQPH